MHEHQMPWHFLSCQTIIFLSVYLQLMIEFQLHPPTPPNKKKKKTFLLCVCIPNTHSCCGYTRQHAQQSLSPAFRWGAYGNSLDYFSPSPKHRCVLWDQRLSVAAAHAHSLAAGKRDRKRGREKERENNPLLNNPPHHSELCQALLPPFSRLMPDTLASPVSITSP